MTNSRLEAPYNLWSAICTGQYVWSNLTPILNIFTRDLQSQSSNGKKSERNTNVKAER